MALSAQNADNLVFAAMDCITMSTERRIYRSDTTDEQWQMLGPELERLSPESHLGSLEKFLFEKSIAC